MENRTSYKNKTKQKGFGFIRSSIILNKLKCICCQQDKYNYMFFRLLI